MNLELNEQELNLVLTALIQLPFKDVASLIMKINDSIQKQSDKPTTE